MLLAGTRPWTAWEGFAMPSTVFCSRHRHTARHGFILPTHEARSNQSAATNCTEHQHTVWRVRHVMSCTHGHVTRTACIANLSSAATDVLDRRPSSRTKQQSWRLRGAGKHSGRSPDLTPLDTLLCACVHHLLACETSPSCALGVRIWRLNRVTSAGLLCLDRTGSAGCARSTALPKSAKWLSWLEQA
jgi:hypothetical protein